MHSCKQFFLYSSTWKTLLAQLCRCVLQVYTFVKYFLVFCFCALLLEFLSLETTINPMESVLSVAMLYLTPLIRRSYDTLWKCIFAKHFKDVNFNERINDTARCFELIHLLQN